MTTPKDEEQFIGLNLFRLIAIIYGAVLVVLHVRDSSDMKYDQDSCVGLDTFKSRAWIPCHFLVDVQAEVAGTAGGRDWIFRFSATKLLQGKGDPIEPAPRKDSVPRGRVTGIMSSDESDDAAPDTFPSKESKINSVSDRDKGTNNEEGNGYRKTRSIPKKKPPHQSSLVEVDRTLIENICKCIGPEWRDLGKFLGYGDGTLDMFEIQEDAIHNMLSDWIQTNPFIATVGNLAQGLWKAGGKNLEREEELLNDHLKCVAKYSVF
ncbi:hypothetical protein AAG570_000150 [Ranatra chinensis]|uniref:Death domain-containing protein n=1 Tax=Ranatra chinensis TaxID=642074 RepID=A0ABD0ZD65_9HEMI